jgi:hypothetical protein
LGILNFVSVPRIFASNQPSVSIPRASAYWTIIVDLARVHLRRSAKTHTYGRAWP